MVSLRPHARPCAGTCTRARTQTHTHTHTQAAQEEEKERLQRLGISKVPARAGARPARKHPRRGLMRRGAQERRRVCACVRVCVRALGAGDVRGGRVGDGDGEWGSEKALTYMRFLLKVRYVRILDTFLCSGALIWLFSPACDAVKLTLKVGFICPFMVDDPTDLGATIVVAQALCLSIFNLSPTQKTCLFTNGNKANVSVWQARLGKFKASQSSDVSESDKQKSRTRRWGSLA